MPKNIIYFPPAYVGASFLMREVPDSVADAMLAAGAMLTEGKVIEARQLWGGRPARFMRELDDMAIMGMRLP